MVQFYHQKINNGCLILSSLPLEQVSDSSINYGILWKINTETEKRNLFQCQKAYFTKWHGV